MAQSPNLPPTRRRFGDASWATRHALQGQQGHNFPVSRYPDQHGHQPFRPLPAPVGMPPYHLALDSVIPIDAKAGTLVFHMVGDSGGVKTPVPPGTHRSG